jgi:hypothetical protein
VKLDLPPTFFGADDKADALLGKGVTGVLLSDLGATAAALDEQRRGPRALALEAAAEPMSRDELKKRLERYETERQGLVEEVKLQSMAAGGSGGRYKARPLNGIWATAPYLHNGSVPTLRALLTAPALRDPVFCVGSREFDPVDVGFESKSGPFTFDTRLPGNSNRGHSIGTQLTEPQKNDLLEYLKTL